MKTKQEIKDIIENIDANIERSFVTAQFGDNWKTHTKKLFEKDEIDIDAVINIAWKQGRKAILLERLLLD